MESKSLLKKLLGYWDLRSIYFSRKTCVPKAGFEALQPIQQNCKDHSFFRAKAQRRKVLKLAT